MLQIIAAGRIGKDAETRTAGSSEATSFTVAVDTGFGDKKITNWIDCTIWGDRGKKLAPHLKKGTPVTVTGEGGLRSWESNGKSGTSLTCRVNEVTLQGGKSDGGQGNDGYQEPKKSSGKSWEPPADLDDDIPF